MKTAVVILNWNTEGFLKKFLPPLLSSVNRIDGAEVVVADNASSDGSLKVMANMFPQVRTIALDKNYGFTGGYNRALAQIEAEYYVLINSDIEVEDGWLEPLIYWMDTHPECGACAPKLRNWYEKDRFEYAGAAGGYIDRFGYPFCRGRILGRTQKDEGQFDNVQREVFWASGACLMVRSGLYRELGGLDDRFFAHMEEIDLCWRMQLNGYSVCVIPESRVFHVGGGTLPASSPFKLFLNHRNNLLMLKKNLAKTYALRFIDKEALKTEGSSKEIAKAAAKAVRKADWLIFIRMVLDSMSAAVYLLTFKPKGLQAVWKAHMEYRRKMDKIGPDEVGDFIKSCPGAKVRGIYGKFIVLQSALRGEGIFGYIDDKDFIKFE